MKFKKINQHFFQREDVEQSFIFLADEITYDSCSEIMENILTLNVAKTLWDRAVADGNTEGVEKPPEVINLMISSGGGDVSAAFALIAMMEASEIPVRTIGLSNIGSSAFMIFIKGHQRVVTPFCSILSHQFSSTLEANYGNLKATMKEYHAFHDKICQLYIDATGLSKDDVEKHLLTDVDVWLSPEEAVSYHAADLISDLK